MNTKFREIIGMPTFGAYLGVASLKTALDSRQKKAFTNIKHCANDQWGMVNGWYDERNEEYRSFMLDARALFDRIYSESLENVYRDGTCSFGPGAAAFLKDIRFCGKPFLQTVALYFTAKLMEESTPEVEGTEEDAERIARDLLAIKDSITLYKRNSAGA